MFSTHIETHLGRVFLTFSFVTLQEIKKKVSYQTNHNQYGANTHMSYSDYYLVISEVTENIN